MSCRRQSLATVLALVDRIVRLQEGGMPAPPPRLPKAQLRDYAQLPQRAELAALTDSIAALAHGVLAMERWVRIATPCESCTLALHGFEISAY